jgi:hypothetical protein
MKLAGENRQLGEKSVPVPLYPPQISHGLDLGSNLGLRGERPATNRLSHGTAYDLFSQIVLLKKAMSKRTFFVSMQYRSLYMKTYLRFIVAGDINLQ